MSKKILLSSLLASLVFYSCEEPKHFPTFKDEGIKHNIIVLARHGNDIRLRGLKGALPALSKLSLKIDDETIATSSGSDGAFDVSMKNAPHSQTKTANITFLLPAEGEKSFTYRIRELDTDISKIVGEKLPYFGDITDFSVSTDVLAINAGHTASFNRFRLNKHWSDFISTLTPTLLNPSLGANPVVRNLVELEEHYVVSLFNTNSLVLIRKKNGEVVHTTILKNPDDSAYLLSLGETLTTSVKHDVLNDGNAVSSFDKSIAFNPDALFAVDDTKFLASFTNYYEMASSNTKNAVVGRGLVALLEVRDDAIKTLKIVPLDYKNPQYFFGFLKDKNTIWLESSGAWKYGTDQYKASNAGLTKLLLAGDLRDISVDKNIAIDNFSCGKPALVNDQIIIPEFFGERVFVLSTNAVTQSEGTVMTSPKKGSHKFLEAEAWYDTIVFISDASGSLIAFDINDGFYPFPFVEPLPVVKDIPPFVYAPRKILFRQGAQGFDYAGNNGLVMLLQKQIVTLDFLMLFSP